MPSIKESINNKSLRIKSPCAVKNPVYSAPSEKIAFIISGSADCGKTSTVCYIAEELRKYYGSRQVTAVLNETLQKEILHVAMIDGDVNKCMGFSSKGDERENVLNNVLSLCLGYSRILVIAVRDEKKGSKAGMVSEVETLCTAFGFSVKKYPLTRAASEPAGGVHNPPADDVVAEIKRIIP